MQYIHYILGITVFFCSVAYSTNVPNKFIGKNYNNSHISYNYNFPSNHYKKNYKFKNKPSEDEIAQRNKVKEEIEKARFFVPGEKIEAFYENFINEFPKNKKYIERTIIPQCRSSLQEYCEKFSNKEDIKKEIEEEYPEISVDDIKKSEKNKIARIKDLSFLDTIYSTANKKDSLLSLEDMNNIFILQRMISNMQRENKEKNKGKNQVLPFISILTPAGTIINLLKRLVARGIYTSAWVKGKGEKYYLRIGKNLEAPIYLECDLVKQDLPTKNSHKKEMQDRLHFAGFVTKKNLLSKNPNFHRSPNTILVNNPKEFNTEKKIDLGNGNKYNYDYMKLKKTGKNINQYYIDKGKMFCLNRTYNRKIGKVKNVNVKNAIEENRASSKINKEDCYSGTIDLGNGKYRVEIAQCHSDTKYPQYIMHIIDYDKMLEENTKSKRDMSTSRLFFFRTYKNHERKTTKYIKIKRVPIKGRESSHEKFLYLSSFYIIAQLMEVNQKPYHDYMTYLENKNNKLLVGSSDTFSNGNQYKSNHHHRLNTGTMGMKLQLNGGVYPSNNIVKYQNIQSQQNNHNYYSQKNIVSPQVSPYCMYTQYPYHNSYYSPNNRIIPQPNFNYVVNGTHYYNTSAAPSYQCNGQTINNCNLDDSDTGSIASGIRYTGTNSQINFEYTVDSDLISEDNNNDQ